MPASTPMIKGWIRHLELTVKSQTGFSGTVLALGLLALLGAALTLGFLLLPADIALAERYGPLTAALLLGGLFLLITITALLCALSSQRRTIAGAKLALAARSQTPLLDPQYLRVGVPG